MTDRFRKQDQEISNPRRQVSFAIEPYTKSHVTYENVLRHTDVY